MSIIRDMSRLIPDELYIKLMYYKHFGKFPDLKNPKSFNEKLQWLKIHDRRPEYTTMVDKYRVKKYVADLIGEDYIIPTLGVWKDAKEIEWQALPQQFVLKCNNDSGGIVICKDKSTLDIDKTVSYLNKRLKQNGYWYGREWPYKNVEPRIIAEQYMQDYSNYGKQNDSDGLSDYKIHSFNGIPRVILVCRNRYSELGLTEDFFNDKWHHLDVARKQHGNSSIAIPKPEQLDTMLDLASKLSKNIPFVRSDFYTIDDKVYFGELTFYPAGGFDRFVPDRFDEEMGDWLQLPVRGGVMLYRQNTYLLLQEEESRELVDFKFYCFNGEPKFLYIARANFDENGNKNDIMSFKDLNWQDTPFGRSGHKPFDGTIEKPQSLPQMIRIARTLSEGKYFARIDLYEINTKVYFSEITLYPGSGLGAFTPEEWEMRIGDWIELPI